MSLSTASFLRTPSPGTHVAAATLPWLRPRRPFAKRTPDGRGGDHRRRRCHWTAHTLTSGGSFRCQQQQRNWPLAIQTMSSFRASRRDLSTPFLSSTQASVLDGPHLRMRRCAQPALPRVRGVRRRVVWGVQERPDAADRPQALDVRHGAPPCAGDGDGRGWSAGRAVLPTVAISGCV